MSNAERKVDVLVLGATGFTGRLIAQYLATHSQKQLFVLGLGARSEEKLKQVADELGIANKVDEFVNVDVKDKASVERAVKRTRVVINVVGPYWHYGTPVVDACVRNQVHYVDLCGESTWMRQIILQYDFAASRNRTIIVPACGYDSVPSDIVAWLANKTLKSYASLKRPGEQFIGIRSSISAQRPKGGFSGGTAASGMAMLEDTPKEVRRAALVPYSLSPVEGGKQQRPKLVYELSVPSLDTIVGAFWFMRTANVWVVQRTFGLIEALGKEVHGSAISTSERKAQVDQMRYGPNFMYDEFMEQPSKLTAMFTSTFLFLGIAMVSLFSPVRWLVKKMLPQSGEGPSEEERKKGSFTITNVTTSDSTPPINVTTIMTGQGDPGYASTCIMISECALSLLLSPHAYKGTPTSELTDVFRPTEFARQGGVLTPMTAFGEDLITRLCETAKFTFASYVTEGKEKVHGALEAKKDI
ncbi:hypothetical protein FA13DRAFT_1657074 [Coprinellus micaceus]|uniref:Saccharopine dehydrogenase NADP binding domain-containing protein n=1 Tax=Coprinellus micaceus TaxID=71717 RepID=A0A4Y7TVF2_COPMI|nr:hypothetical protein FA13DRAFT_1657074 [Coprinellus micaceus]